MVFTAFLQAIGLLDVLAPPTTTTPHKRTKKDEQREKLAAETKKKLVRQAEERRRLAGVEERVRAQCLAERAAAERNQFAKHQRVSYAASEERRYDAVVVGVHFDDDPDHPYYTIKYKRFEENVGTSDNNGLSKPATKNIIEVEKQTNPERLTSVPWDKQKTQDIVR